MILAGFVNASTGVLSKNGVDITHVPAEKRNFGMVFQGYALFPHLTIFENIAFGIKHWSKQDQINRVSYLLDLVGLSGYDDRYPHSLSGGQQQRIALARAMAPKPRLLLMDEPFSGLDTKLREELVPEIRQILLQENMSAILVTHDQLEAFAMADQVSVMSEGCIHQTGTAYQIYHRPSTRFVASFMGSPAMNFLSATLENGKLLVAGQSIPVPEYSGLNQEVVLGIRPEHADTQASEASLKLNMKMSVIEPLGPNQLVHGKVEGQAFIAVTPETSFELNSVLEMFIAQENLHLFDAEGKRIIPKLQ